MSVRCEQNRTVLGLSPDDPGGDALPSFPQAFGTTVLRGPGGRGSLLRSGFRFGAFEGRWGPGRAEEPPENHGDARQQPDREHGTDVQTRPDAGADRDDRGATAIPSAPANRSRSAGAPRMRTRDQMQPPTRYR